MVDNERSLVEHLEEFRTRLLICLGVFLFSSLIAYFFIDNLFLFATRDVGKLVFTQPTEAFFAYIKLALYAGFFISLPIILYQIWQFVSVALKDNEKKYLLLFLPFSLFLFLLGAVFAYFVVVPISLKFLLGFGGGSLTPMLTIGGYLSFLCSFLLVFGIVFELPVVFAFLTKIGVVNAKKLSSFRREAILAIFIGSAILTPTPDAFTQILMAVPLMILYEISIFISKIIGRRK